MIQQNELITLLVGFGVFLYLILSRRNFIHIPGYKFLLVSYMVLFTGWILTVVEGFFFGSLLNILEHLCYSVSSLLIAVWCWTVFIRDRGSG